jgi:hypothetical protein
MNNKYLAIVLSIVAVLVVIYQAFLRKPTKSIQQQMNQSREAGAMYSTVGRQSETARGNKSVPSPSDSPSAAVKSGEKKVEGLVIDYNSRLLWERINPELAIPYSKQELPDDFGVKIFTRGKLSEDKPTGPKYEKELEFNLNAIIIDEKRRIAIINNTILQEGDIIQGAEIISIIKSRVTLKINDEQFVLATNSRIKKIRLMGGRGEL